MSALPTAHNQNVNSADVLAMFIPEKAASVYGAVLMAFQLTLAWEAALGYRQLFPDSCFNSAGFKHLKASCTSDHRDNVVLTHLKVE